ncbi:Sua5/YciO/YrdC/YwlC family protein [cyanobiont of Ornithocercus magnificus]|nr:Sua5/YciO/YrdC/YwlC family protein [cyanobiont of Ornithocercus magnificus]
MAKILARQAMSSALLAGGAAIVPTDTLPALAALPQHAAQLWKLKRRPKDKPLILMAATVEELLQYVQPQVRNEIEALAWSHWPGALTLVLPAQGVEVELLHPGAEARNLGLRVPACSVLQRLLRCVGPLATTSANLAGHAPSLDDQQASSCFPDLPLLAPLPWPPLSGSASTVLAWSSPGCWSLLRRGTVIPRLPSMY